MHPEGCIEVSKNHEFVTNRILRGMTIVNYDQAIFFFGSDAETEITKEGWRWARNEICSNRKRGK